jgi:hypothetical protein
MQDAELQEKAYQEAPSGTLMTSPIESTAEFHNNSELAAVQQTVGYMGAWSSLR